MGWGNKTMTPRDKVGRRSGVQGLHLDSPWPGPMSVRLGCTGRAPPEHGPHCSRQGSRGVAVSCRNNKNQGRLVTVPPTRWMAPGPALALPAKALYPVSGQFPGPVAQLTTLCTNWS